MQKVTEMVQAVQTALHLTKPLLLEAMLSAWAVVEMARFMFGVIEGKG